MATRLRVPNGLGAEGRKLWKDIVGEFDFEGEPHKRRVLFDACAVADMVQRLSEAATEAPLTTLGSQRQEVAHPVHTQLLAAREQLARMLGRLSLPETDEALAEKAEKLSRTRRKAARTAHLRTITDAR
jgi:predicted aminopeptidase